MEKNGQTILVIDIGSGSVGSAVVKTGKKNQVDFSTRYELDYGEQVDFGALLQKVMAGIEHTLKQAPVKNLDQISIFLHSPWHTVHTKQIVIESDKPFTVTEKLIEERTKQEVLDFITKDKDKFPGYDSLLVIESIVPEININGYKIPEPFGKKASLCEYTISIALAPENIVEQITNICLRLTTINKKNIKLHSATISLANVSSRLYEKEGGLLLLDIGSELTDISIVKEGVLTGSISFVQGTHDIVRKIASILKTNFSDSLSKAHAVFSGVSTIEILEQVNGTLTPLTASWQRSIAESLLKITNVETIPRKIILVCEDSVLAPWYANAVGSDTFTQYLRGSSHFSCITPTHKNFEDILIIGDISYIDTSLAILCTML